MKADTEDIVSCHATQADAQAQADKMMQAEGGGMMGTAPQRELRSYQIELRVDNQQQPVITGHAAVFNQKSEPIFGFREIVKPGAFTKTIKTADVRALWNHDPNYVLGRTKSGTLSLSEDHTGLAIRINPPDTIFANDLLEVMKRGDVDQMSFGFRTITDAWRTVDGETIRELTEVELFDVSPVTYPAYPQTDVSARSYFESRMKSLSPVPNNEIKTQLAAMRQRLLEKEKGWNHYGY